MQPNRLLTTTSLVSILLMSLHITDDIVRGISRAAPDNVFGVAIFVVWLIGTLMLPQRRTGYAIMLLGGVFAAAMPVLHMRGARYPSVAASDGGFFFVWTLYAVGAAGTLAIILAVRALWSSRAGS